MALGSVLREFGVKLNLAFDKAKVEQAKKSVEEVGKSMREVALHVAEASAALFEFANIAGEHSRKLEDNSDMLGINVERLQEFQYAAKVAANVSEDELVGAFTSIAQTFDKVKYGDVEAGNAFRRLGLSATDLASGLVTPDQALLKLSEKIQGIKDPMARLALVTDTLGGSGEKLLPLLTKGPQYIANLAKEGRGLGLVMSKDLIAKNAEFDRQLTRVWLILKNITYTIGSQLIKYLTPIVMQFQRWITLNKQLISQNIAAVMKAVGLYLEIVFKVAKKVGDAFGTLIHIFGGVNNMAKVLAVAFGLITAVKVVAGIGTLVKSFQALAAVMGIVDWESAAIGAALLAVILVIQDLMSPDSLIMEGIHKLTKAFTEHMPGAAKFLSGAFSIVKDVINDVAQTFEMLWNWITKAADAVVDFADKFGVLKGIKSVFSDAVSGFKTIGGWIDKGLGAVGDMMTAHSSAGASSSANTTSGGGGAQQTFSAQINVGVPANMPAGQATQVVSSGVEDAFGKVMRKARNPALGGVAY